LLIIFSLSTILVLPFAAKVLINWHQISAGDRWGYSFLNIGLQLIKYFNIPLCALTFFSMIWMLKNQFFEGIYFSLSIIIPVLFMMPLSFFVDVRPDYVIYIYPLFFMLSGYFFVQIKENVKNGNFFKISLILLTVACMLPEFLSHYTGKKTLDVREAVRYVEKSFRNGDKILNFHIGFSFYWKDKSKFEPFLGGTYSPGTSSKLTKYENNSNRLWIVLTESRRERAWKLKNWLLENTKLVWEKPEKRYDYTFRTIRIYLKE